MSATNTGNAGGVLYPGDVYGFSTPNPFLLIPGGGLQITLAKYVDSAHTSLGNIWYSGAISSVDARGVGFSQQYGYFEMKANFPKGLGTWPAFWMNSVANLTGALSPGIGEIDIVEQYGNWDNLYRASLHDWTNSTDTLGNVSQVINTPDLTVGYHTYGLMWDENLISFYFDGSLVYQQTTPLEQKQAYYIIADLGIGLRIRRQIHRI
jgi:hypothetical protein